MDKDSDDYKAILKVADDVIDMYLNVRPELASELYTTDDQAPPIVFDVGNSLVTGEPWTKGHGKWMQAMDHYFNVIGREVNGPEVTHMEYIDPEIVIDNNLACFVALLPIGMRKADGEEMTLMTRYTIVLRKFAAKWKIWNEHFSASMNPEVVLGPQPVVN